MRYITKHIMQDLEKKMVFISGPRQVGKTTIAKALSKKEEKSVYLNYDKFTDKKIIINAQWDPESKLVCLDEIHKYSKWKNWLKGLYDTKEPSTKYLVTGSARLDIFRKGQDSMLGRYHHWRLHPFCLAENPLKLTLQKSLVRFLMRGGFPEPYLADSETEAKRWTRQHLELVFSQDVRDLSMVRDIALLNLFLQSLQSKVASPIAVAKLSNELEVAPKTGKSWLNLMEQLYMCFLVYPYAKKIQRGLVKQPKVYFYNNAEVDGDIGAKFENLVAQHLIKKCHYLEDLTGYRYSLNYVRDKEGREIDFVILKENKPIIAIEAKWKDTSVSKSFLNLCEQLGVAKKVQLVGECQKEFFSHGVKVTPATEFLSKPLEKDF